MEIVFNWLIICTFLLPVIKIILKEFKKEFKKDFDRGYNDAMNSK